VEDDTDVSKINSNGSSDVSVNDSRCSDEPTLNEILFYDRDAHNDGEETAELLESVVAAAVWRRKHVNHIMLEIAWYGMVMLQTY
jgi:hypothetical protein